VTDDDLLALAERTTASLQHRTIGSPRKWSTMDSRSSV
jgi:hypothetical protein